MDNNNSNYYGEREQYESTQGIQQIEKETRAVFFKEFTDNTDNVHWLDNSWKDYDNKNKGINPITVWGWVSKKIQKARIKELGRLLVFLNYEPQPSSMVDPEERAFNKGIMQEDGLMKFRIQERIKQLEEEVNQ